ncbi:MAG: Polysialic acid transport protein KpsD precursor [Synergistetes bacterium ADurb.Bin155]|nr:SLBB domain-containing protein [Synergistales bacterium]OQB46439.1 MAG: Polysialic acid transport protein KpsD precursor [Synergistetes bacterium ADurb.Bin155]
MKKVLFLFTCLSLLWCGPAFAQLAEGGSGAEIAIPDIPGTSEAGTIQAPAIPDLNGPGIPDIFPAQPDTPHLPTQAPGASEAPAGWADADPLAEFERFITGSLPEDRLTQISRYGSEFFRTAPSTFAPDEAAPVRPDYVIGPGDQLRIDVWGMVEGSWTVTVSRDGTITIPRVGVIGVAGLDFEQLQDVLDEQFSRFYSNYEMSVTLGALKNIKVYVVGNARRPGGYTISSLSTLVNALLVSGGPNESGSMRSVQVKRGGKVVTDFDLYDLLMKGDKTKDIRLMPEDVIFIPNVGPQVAVTGNVRRPAIYEMKKPLSVDGLIEMAGGMTSTGFEGRIQLMRVVDRQYRTMLEGDLKALSRTSLKGTTLQDGDYLRLFSVVERQSVVRVSGPVAKPGEFAINGGVNKVSDVIHWAGGLLYYAADEAEITRVEVTDSGPKTTRIKVSLGAALKGDPAHNITLQMNDYIFVRAVPDWQLYKQVAVYGEVTYPGVYTIGPGERLSSLIERAGGFSLNAYTRGAIFTRESVKKAQQQQIDEMVQRFEKDLLAVGLNELSSALTPDETRMLQMEAQQKTRLLEALRNTKATGRVTTMIAAPSVLKGSAYDIELEHGDKLYVPRNPSTVQVIGAVLNPSSFVYDKNLSYKQYILMAGGYSREASPERVYVLKADGTAMRTKESARATTPWVKEFNQDIEWNLIEPGDAIVVPQKIESYRGLRQTRDYVDIIYKMAVTALSIHNITN